MVHKTIPHKFKRIQSCRVCSHSGIKVSTNIWQLNMLINNLGNKEKNHEEN